MKKLTVILGLVLVMCLLVPVSCAKASPPAPVPTPESGQLTSQLEILDITITGYHSTYDIEGNYDPDRVEATLSWETKKPCYYCFEVNPVDFDYPTNSGGYEKFDTSAPLQEQVKHSRPIVLKSGKLHHCVLTIWDKEKNYITKSDTFWAPVVPKAPPPPAPAPAPAPAPPTPPLTELFFTLSEEHDLYRIPVYIRAGQTLHLDWTITKGGDSLWISFTTPNGKLIGMRADGGFNDYWPSAPSCERLVGMGNIILSPSEHDWGEGYYYFLPHISKGQPSITVEVQYWIED